MAYDRKITIPGELDPRIHRSPWHARPPYGRHHGKWAAADDETIRQFAALHDAQFALAREQGFASWPRLRAYAQPSARPNYTRLFVADPAWIAERARGLWQTRLSAGPARSAPSRSGGCAPVP